MVKKSSRIIYNAITLASAIIAFILLAYGMKNGGMSEVLNKARMICLECIGIG